MVAIITLVMIMRYTINHLPFNFYSSISKNLLTYFSVTLKNVDAGAAKELMAYLVKLQSSLPEVNK